MSDREVIHSTLSRVNARAWGIATGLILGLGLFVATNVLLLRGGEDVGAHLGRLSNVLPGYNVSFLGSLLGLVYGFVIGYGLGRLIGPRSPLRGSGPRSRTQHGRLNGSQWGWTLGIAGALLLVGVTNVLALKGGEHKGELLAHLHTYFPGYSIDLVGSLVGAAWVVALGWLVGQGIALVYNGAVDRAEA